MTTFHAGFAAGAAPVSVRFGAGARHDLSPELTALGITRALILTTPQQRAAGEALSASLGARAAGCYHSAAMHTPVEVTEAALHSLTASGADGLVAIGGGSTIGLAKALALRTDLPQIVLPSTYAGSEATPVLGQTENGEKTTLTSPKVQPEAIVYDPELVATLPLPMTVTSALNAMAHAIEALYAPDANPLSSALAMEGVRVFHSALPALMKAPEDLALREATQFGAWLCGTVLAQVGMSLHHKLCHVLGGTLGLPHAQTHAILLPHAMAYNEAASPALAPLAALFDSTTAAAGIQAFSRALGAPQSLAALGVNEADLDRLAALACAKPYPNPRPLTRQGIRTLLQNALTGAPL